MTGRELSALHFFPSFAFGGQQRRLGALVQGLGAEFAHRIYALDGDISGASLIDDHARASIEPLVLRKSALVSLSNIRGLCRLIAESDADLICTYNFGSIEAVIANRVASNLPHVHHEDGFGPDELHGGQKAKRVLARRFLLNGSIVTVPSAVLENIALNVWKLDRSRVHKIPVGINLERYVAPKSNGREGPLVVGSIGSLRAEKNFSKLIRCFKEAAAGADARLVIFGEGPERPRLEAEAAQDPRISLPGSTTRPEAALAGFDIFALSSDTEQTPISLMEAMAMGLPALATDVGDVKTMLGEASRDFVVRTNDDATYVDRLASLLRDGGLRKSLGAANAIRAPMFDERAMIEAFRALYLQAAGVAAA